MSALKGAEIGFATATWDAGRCRSWVKTGREQMQDDLVLAGEQRRGHVEGERLRGLEVDDQFVFGRGLHRQVGRLLPSEDAIDVAGRASVLVEVVEAVGHQTTAHDWLR